MQIAPTPWTAPSILAWLKLSTIPLLIILLLRRPARKFVLIGIAGCGCFAALCVERLIACFHSRRRRVERVAIIGGGIAGFGAAHSLCSSGTAVDLFEACDTAGGNAKTHQWPDGPVTGLSVLAWPPGYFRNYVMLLRTLGLPMTPVALRFFLRRAPDGESFVHGRTAELSLRYAADFKRWARLVALVRACNAFFARSGDVKSLYHFSLLNPMNVLPLRTLCRLCGVSAAFWRDVIVPLHCTTFLATDLELIPAVVVPTIDDLIPLDATPTLESWRGSSRDVFRCIAERAGEKLSLHLRCPVERIARERDGRWTVLVCAADGCGEAVAHRGYDRVVIASNAQQAAKALPRSWAWWGARALLASVDYADATCGLFRRGVIHSDESVIPADAREEVLARCCNYIEAYSSAADAHARGDARSGDARSGDARSGDARSGDTHRTSDAPQFENTFVLSSWYPPVRRADAEAQLAKGAEGDGRARLVSYGLRHPERVREPLGYVENVWNHPSLTPAFLAATMLLRMAQGRQGVYFCGSMATPGNGHDLSLCSGLAVAAAMGARYPFDDADAAEDLSRLRKILGV